MLVPQFQHNGKARQRIRARADLGHHSRQLNIRAVSQTDLCLFAHNQLVHGVKAHRKRDFETVLRVDRSDGCATGDRGERLHLNRADDGVKRGDQHRLLQVLDRAVKRPLRLHKRGRCRFNLGQRIIYGNLSGGAPLQQLFLPFIRRLGIPRGGFGLIHRGLCRLHLQLQRRLIQSRNLITCGQALAHGKVHLLNFSANLKGNRRQLRGFQNSRKTPLAAVFTG